MEEEDGWEVETPYPGVMGPYAHRDKLWVGFDDEGIVREKAHFVNEESLGGIMFWTIDNDDFRSACGPRPFPLIEAAKEALYGKDAAIKTYDLFYDFSHSLLIPSFPSFPISCTAQLDFSSFLQFSIFFRFSATSVSISTSEQTRVERLRLTRKQLAALARYTLKHIKPSINCPQHSNIIFPSLFIKTTFLIFSSTKNTHCCR